MVEKKQFKYDSRGRIIKEEKKEEAPKPKFVPIESNVKLASYHEFLGHAHLQNYNINLKINEFDQLDRVFDKSKSVFKDWKLDKPKLIKEGLIDEV